MNSKYIRLFADPNGQSHFEECETELSPVEFVAGMPPLYLSSPTNAKQISFFGAPAGWSSDWHASQNRNLFVLISGVWEITASDGESRVVRPGDVLLVDDTSGRGHRSRVTGEEDSLAVMIQLD